MLPEAKIFTHNRAVANGFRAIFNRHTMYLDCLISACNDRSSLKLKSCSQIPQTYPDLHVEAERRNGVDHPDLQVVQDRSLPSTIQAKHRDPDFPLQARKSKEAREAREDASHRAGMNPANVSALTKAADDRAEL